MKGNLQIVDRLLKNGAEVNAKNNYGVAIWKDLSLAIHLSYIDSVPKNFCSAWCSVFRYHYFWAKNRLTVFNCFKFSDCFILLRIWWEKYESRTVELFENDETSLKMQNRLSTKEIDCTIQSTIIATNLDSDNSGPSTWK